MMTPKIKRGIAYAERCQAIAEHRGGRYHVAWGYVRINEDGEGEEGHMCEGSTPIECAMDTDDPLMAIVIMSACRRCHHE